MEESAFAVQSVLWRSVFHLLSKLRAWMIKVKRSRFKGVDLVFFVDEGSEEIFVVFEHLWYFACYVGCSLVFCCVEMFAGVFA